jgi:hypothetical protein
VLTVIPGPSAARSPESIFTEAIAELRSAKTEPAPSEGSSPAPAAPSKDSAAERRQLTVLFARQVHGWFTEGFDTRDLKDAKTLLEELAA